MKIIFTKHANKKFLDPSITKLRITRRDIKETVKKPDFIDSEIDYPKIIMTRSYDQKHVIRVVFRKIDDIIRVITFYPARKGRYEKK